MSIEAMRQALEALDSDNPDIQLRAATVLRAAIEQTEKQDGECKRCDGKGCVACDARRVCSGCDKTNTDNSMWAVYCVDCWNKTASLPDLSPDALEQAMIEVWQPVLDWVGLTEIEICDIEAVELTSASSETFSFARAIEAKLKEKNT